MKILVVSDTHGVIFESIVQPIRKEKDIDLMIHCGDKYKDAEKLAWVLGIRDFYRVTGNCDYDIHNKEDMLIQVIEGKQVLITHGHLQYVKDGLNDLKELAVENHADIVLYGHTHIAHEELCNNVLYFNPGSTIMPKYAKPSYGIIEIMPDKVLSRIVNL